MPFTETEAQKIRQYLGYSELHPRSETQTAIDTVGASAEALAIVQTFIIKLDALDTELDVNVLTVAGISSVGGGEVEYFASGKIKDLRMVGRGLCKKLSIKMGLDIYSDYFSASSSAGGAPPTFFG